MKYYSNVAQSAKKCLRVLKIENSAPNSKKCSKDAQSNRERPNRRTCVFVGLAWTVPFQKSFVSDLRSYQNGFVNSKTTRYCGLISCLFCLLSSPYFASTSEFPQYNSLSIRRASSLGLTILRIVHNQRKGTTVKFRK